jgi:hypothetical protein
VRGRSGARRISWWGGGVILPVASALMLAGCSSGLSAPPATTQPTAAADTPAPTPAAVTPSATPASISVSSSRGTTEPTPPPGTIWVRVSDPGAAFTFEVPSNWANVAVSPWEEGGTNVGVLLVAGPDPSKIGSDFSVPGIAIGLSANAAGLTPLALVQEDDYSSACTATAAQSAAEPGAVAAYRTWESCGPSRIAFLLLMGIVPQGSTGLVGVVFQGASEADQAYLEHILGSLAAEGGAVSTPVPIGTGQPGQPYSLSMDICQNQHGQGVAEGNITNQDAVAHTFRVIVDFYDFSGTTLLNDAGSYDLAVDPGTTRRWQAIVSSGLPSGEITCKVKEVQMR